MDLRSLATFALIVATLAVETRLSRSHERTLRARGAEEPPGDVYRMMRIVYPGAFAGMFIENMQTGAPPFGWWVFGALLWALSKALKYWTIRSLGARWSFRVLAVPGDGLVTSGPYRFVTHPNYVALIGEFVSSAIMLAAPIAGILSMVAFSTLLAQRVHVEERFLESLRARAPRGAEAPGDKRDRVNEIG